MPIRIGRPDGERVIDFLYEPVRDDAGQVAGIFVGGYDVAEQKRGGERLVRSEAELRIAHKARRLGTWTLDIASGESAASETCKTNFGRPPDAPFSYDELRGAMYPDDRARMVAVVERSLTTGEDYDIEYRIVTPTGEIRWVQIRGQPSYDANGTPLSMTGVSLDISDRRHAEGELRDTAERLWLATENAEIGFWDADPIIDLIIWPPRTKAMFGISPEVPVSMADFYAGLHPDDSAATTEAYLAAADRAGAPFTMSSIVQWARRMVWSGGWPTKAAVCSMIRAAVFVSPGRPSTSRRENAPRKSCANS